MSTTLQRSRTRRGAAYRETGRGEPVVLIHGVGLRAEAWAPQMAALERDFRVVAVDMPGHGDSAPLPVASTLSAFVAWFGEVMDDLELSSANVVGHSMGALIAGGAAASFGERVAGVALINGVFRRSAEARAAVMARAREIADGAALDVEGPLERWFGRGEGEARRQVRDWLSRVDRQGYATAYAAFADGDATYADRFGDIRCPALFLTGRDDPNSTPAMAAAMAEAAPNGRARVIEGRHMINLTHRDEVNRILAEWLAEPKDAS